MEGGGEGEGEGGGRERERERGGDNETEFLNEGVWDVKLASFTGSPFLIPNPHKLTFDLSKRCGIIAQKEGEPGNEANVKL